LSGTGLSERREGEGLLHAAGGATEMIR